MNNLLLGDRAGTMEERTDEGNMARELGFMNIWSCLEHRVDLKGEAFLKFQPIINLPNKQTKK